MLFITSPVKLSNHSFKKYNCMRKFCLLLLAAMLVIPAMATSPATVVSPTPVKAADIMIPVGQGALVSLEQLAWMKPAAFAKLRGKKMNLGDRIGFWLTQKKLRRSINADGTVQTEKLKDLYRADPAGGFHVGGFLLGLILGIIGVLIAYLIKDDKKPMRTKWAWIGLIASIVITLLLII